MSYRKESDEETLDITIKPVYKKFYSEESSYGIYSASLTSDSENLDVIKCDGFTREIVLVGNMPSLESGKTYQASVVEKSHPKFGIQYEAKLIYERQMTTHEEQKSFLNTILTKKQADTLINAYPEGNLLELIKTDNVDLNLLNGIGEKIIEKIKLKIVENEKYQKAIIELTSKFDIPYKSVKKMSEEYGSPELLIEKINENPYILTEINGFGFKRVDEIALKIGVEKDSKQRIESCLEYIIVEQAENSGHVWIKETTLISESIKLLGIRMASVQNALIEIIEDDRNNISKLGKTLFNINNFSYELGVSDNIKRLLDVKPITSLNFDFDEAVKKVENNQGFEFTKEQVSAIQMGIENNIIVVNGKAGTGKTAVIKGIIEVLDMYNESLKDSEKMEYATCALSGKASQRIQESTGLKSSTIHRLLGFNPREGWVYNEDNKLAVDVIVLDEASMVNSQLFFYLIRAIKSGAKLIITGDIAQLEPIGIGNVLVDILSEKTTPSVELTIVHRQAQKSGILSCANMVREGIHFMPYSNFKFKKLGELKDLYLYPNKDKEGVFERVITIAKKYKEDIMDFQILTPMKSRGELSTQNLNNELQKIFNKDPKDVDDSKKIKRKNNTLLEGDKVIINGNDYDKNVFNGTMGIIEHIDLASNEIIIDFETVGRILFGKDGLNNIDLGYAITVHKSQGSQWKYVVLAFDYSSYVLLNRQLVYTGMTRAIKVLFLAVENKALKYAIETDKSSKRNTFLPFLLSNNEKILNFLKEYKSKKLQEKS